MIVNSGVDGVVERGFRRSGCRRVVVVVQLHGITDSVGQGNVKLKDDLVLLKNILYKSTALI